MSSPSPLRLARPADAEQIQSLYAPYVCDTPVSFEMEPPTVAQTQERITNTLLQFPWLVCEHQEEIVGYVYATTHRARAAYVWSVDVAVYVQSKRHRFGIGRALYTSLLDLLALQGFYNAFAGITLPNPASVGLHEALGFHPIGVYETVGYKQGAWHNVGWWQRTLRECSPSPAPPLSLDEAQRDAGWEAALNRGLPLLKW